MSANCISAATFFILKIDIIDHDIEGSLNHYEEKYLLCSVESHAAVETIVRLADEFNVVVIPYGGGTSVSGSVSCPHEEARTIMALDTSQMVSEL